MSCKNVLLVTVDSLRADYVGATKNGTPLTPRVDELGEDGVVFPEAIANGSSTPTSFPSILTSTHPLMHGGYQYLGEERPFVAETFADAGFETVAYHSNPHLGPDMNYDSGFDRFNDRGDASEHSDVGPVNRLKNAVEERVPTDSAIYGLLRRGWHMLSMTTGTAAYADATAISESALEWIEEWGGERPFFMWLHFMDVHYPFMPPAEHLEAIGVDPPSRRRTATINGRMHENPGELTDQDRETLLDLYQGEIRYTDYEIGRILDRLAEREALDETLVAVTADHGEAFGEHGHYGHHPSPYDELVRVPLVLQGPGVGAGSVVEEQVSLLDLGPTFYDLADVEWPDAVQGESLEPLLTGDATARKRRAITTGSKWNLACRTPKWKCIWRRADDENELYDLDADPGETENVAREYPEVVDELRAEIDAHLEAVEATDTEQPDAAVSEEVQSRLRELGYVE